MFAKTIIDSDACLDMPQSSQLLYFHLSMRADDDGFVSNPKKIIRMMGAGDDDFKVLMAKRFLIPFESGVCVVKHWKIHNYIQTDRYQPTSYLKEKELLVLNENGSYTEKKETCIQNGYISDTQVRLGKVRVGKVRLGKVNKDISKDISIEKSFNKVVKSSFGNKDINTLLQEFEKSFGFAPKPVQQNRWAANRLIKAHGLEWVLSVLKATVVIQDEPYSPKIYSLIDLEKKLPNIAGFYKRKKIKGGIRL